MKKKKIKYDVAKNGEEAVSKWRTGGFHLILVSLNDRERLKYTLRSSTDGYPNANHGRHSGDEGNQVDGKNELFIRLSSSDSSFGGCAPYTPFANTLRGAFYLHFHLVPVQIICDHCRTHSVILAKRSSGSSRGRVQ